MRLGWYVHHHGSGHRQRALSVASALPPEVVAGLTGLSTSASPPGWPGEWVRLPSDGDPASPGQDVTAGGRLHWAPYRHEGTRVRAAALSAWIATERPDVLVSDVSVETALLARLHGVRVVSLVMPGWRGDPAHTLGYDVSAALVAAWPPAATADVVTGLDAATRERITAVGAISRFAGRRPHPVRRGTVAVLLGDGGDDLAAGWAERAARTTPGWSWTVLGGSGGRWLADPWPAISSAEVVVTHAGQNAVADVAAARRPAVVIAMTRPFEEQQHTARALERDGSWPVVVAPNRPDWPHWPALLERARTLDGARWSTWGDDGSAARLADVVVRELRACEVLA